MKIWLAWLLLGVFFLATTPIQADKVDRLLRRQARVTQDWVQAENSLDAGQVDVLLTSIARYQPQVRHALLATAVQFSRNTISDPTDALRQLLPVHLRPQASLGEILAAFPDLTDDLAELYVRHGEEMLEVLDQRAEVAKRIDRDITKKWIEALENSPAALNQLEDVSRFFQEEFERARTLRRAYNEKIAEAKQRADAIAKQRKQLSTTTVMVVGDPYYSYYRPPYATEYVMGYPYDTYSVYSWTRSPTMPYYGFSGDPQAGIRRLEKAAVGVWHVPSYQVIQFILSNADLYPDLAAVLVELNRRYRTPETMRGAIAAWSTEVLSDPEALEKEKNKPKYLARLAAAQKRDVQIQDDSESGLACPPGEQIDGPSTDTVCPEAIIQRYLTATPDAKMTSLTPIPMDIDQVEEDHFRRARNMHVALWAGLTLKRLQQK